MTLREPRLVIAGRPARRDHLHGAWWPYSRDIECELAPMLTMVGTRFRTVFGVALSRVDWPSGPLARHLAGPATITWDDWLEPHLAVLYCGRRIRIALLVLPPDMPEEIALTATLMAVAPGNNRTPSQTLARAREQATASPG
ncbi:MAG TPA: DUF5994 family protein [Jatrophihabitans sp.]|jgi:hypothetical protein|nr:DUF5994 family protein [Jatrophihabitans sp.]